MKIVVIAWCHLPFKKKAYIWALPKKGGGEQTYGLIELISYKVHTMCPKYNLTSKVSKKVSPISRVLSGINSAF